MEEMQQASDDLTKSIVTIKSKNQTEDQSFLADKGNLRPPVDGVLVTLFQQEKVNKLGISRKSLGIELQASGRNQYCCRWRWRSYFFRLFTWLWKYGYNTSRFSILYRDIEN